MKQTAVEWLKSMIKGMIENGGDLGEDLPALMNHIEQAKAMEKEQIKLEKLLSDFIDFLVDNGTIDTGQLSEWKKEDITNFFKKNPIEQYYNETYGK